MKGDVTVRREGVGVAQREERGKEGRGMLTVEGPETAAIGWGGAEEGARRSERVRVRMRRHAEGGGEGWGSTTHPTEAIEEG